MNVEKNIVNCGTDLNKVVKKGGIYNQAVQFGDKFIYISGKESFFVKLSKEYRIEEGQEK